MKPRKGRVAPTKRELVRIEWASPEHDWQWFWLIGTRGEWLHLQGADYPDGTHFHEGDRFWVHKSECKHIASMGEQ